jgi:type III pantothenate kinase
MGSQTSNLIIDIGNSRTKYGLFVGDDLESEGVFTGDPTVDLLHLAYNQKVKRIIISSTGMHVEPIQRALGADFRILVLDHRTPLPFRVDYLTPETLGRDRLAAVAGAQHLFPGQPCLVIDAGTCITYDLLTAEGIHLGGNIAPGVRMRLQAMHAFTARLPEVEPGAWSDLAGNTTETALRNGAQWGARFELEGYIRAWEEKFPDLKVLVTGGDALFFEKIVKREIFVNSHLVLIGLNQILNYNA